MRIIVISDTHIPVSATKLPEELKERLKECDLIIHAGDVLERSVIDELSGMAETKAVWGNMDQADLKETLPEKIEFKAGGLAIGVTHGRGGSSGMIQRVRKMFRKKMDIIIFGHSHVPVNERIDGTLYFNPGSVTDRIFAPYRSFGVIEIQDGEVRSEIVKLKD